MKRQSILNRIERCKKVIAKIRKCEDLQKSDRKLGYFGKVVGQENGFTTWNSVFTCLINLFDLKLVSFGHGGALTLALHL